MATRSKARKTTPKRKPAATSAVRRALVERDEALKFQAATGEILKVIRGSPSDTQPVFEMIVRNAVSLCNGFFASAFRYDGELLHLVATSIVDPAARKFLAGQYPRPPDNTQMSGRAILARKIVRMEDALADPRYDRRHAEIGSWRRMLGVPMMDQGEPIGVIVVSWADAGPIPKAQEELLKSFADQAVIAIENARLFKEVRERNAELKQSLDFQGATGGILTSISSSVTDAQPVFEAIVDSVLRLFGTRYATVVLIRGEELHLAASKGDPDFEKRRLAVFRQFRASFPQRIDWSGFTGKALRAGEVSQIAPIIGNPQATPQAVQLAKDFGYNAMLLAPLMREGKAIGAIGTTRPEGEPFDAKQLALFEAFAAQAVIAIENARLFNETKEALEKQTATAEILRVISSTPTDATPVFEAIVRNATRLCEAAYANVFRYDGERLHWAASDGWPAELLAELKAAYPATPNRSRVAGRVILEGRAVQLEDTHADSEYDKTLGRSLRYRRILGVPLLREGRTIGVITVGWAAPGPIERRHEDLLKTFADQAVIAIENVRLFNETKEALERQTATADILRVISSSPTNIQPVLEAVAATAARLCEAKDAIIQLREGDVLRFVAHHGKLPNVGVGGTRALSRELVTGRAVLEGRQIHVHDLQAQANEYPRGSEIAREFGYRTILATPLMREGVAIGSIMIRRTEARPFTETQLALMRTFADQAVIAIENVRLFNETKEALEQQKASAEVLGTISSSIADTQPVFEKILESCERLFAGKVVGINVLGKDGMIHLGAYHGAGREAFEKVFPLPVDRDSGSGLAIVERRVVHIPDSEADGVPEAARRGNRARGNRASLYAPMMWHDNAIGVVWVSREFPGPFSEKEIGLLKTFADQAVIAVENARLFHETNEALERQTATSEVLRVISTSPTDVQPVLDSIAERAARLCSATIGVVSKFDGHLVHLVAFYGASAAAGEALRKIYPLKPGDETATARAIRDRAPAQISDVLADPRYVQKEASQQAGFRSIVAVPMVRDRQVVGAIAVTRAEPGVFPEKQVDLLKIFADQAVIAIENVRLFNETKEALEKQTATADILQVLSGSPSETQPVFNAIVSHAARLCDSTYANVFSYDGAQLHLAASHGGSPEALAALHASYPAPPSRKRVVGRVIETGRSVHVEDTLADEQYDRGFAGKLKLRRLLGVPLLRGGQPVGAITIGWAEPGSISQRHEDLLKTFADQAVIAIENVRLFNETKEALEQQTATAEVLKVISASPTDVAPVFDAILRSAVTLCGAELAAVFPFDGELVHLGATHNWPPAALQYFSKVYPSPPSSALLSGRTILSRSLVEIADAAADEHYDPDSVATGHWRRMLGAPMLREGRPLGALVVAWRDPGETPRRQVELLQTFADQAAIAIENARLFNETKEALDQQKASAEVLGTISGSIADTRPVFEKILASCERLFEGELVGITLADGDTVRLAAYHGPQGEQLEKIYPLPLTRESGTGWAILNAQIAHFPDIEAAGVPPGAVAGCRALRVRAIVFAPMLFEGKGIGAIWVARAQPGAFTDKQIAQLRTFADQAVIAIQNARLFREIQEKSAQLEVANKHKSDFLANMSHELRTPLNAIIGFSEVLMERMFGEVNEKQAEYLKDIHESGRHLLSLINDILDLSKIEAGRMELELSSFDLPGAVSNAMTLVRERAQRHGIQLGLDMDPRLGEFQADERKVKQILLNLLSNAVKFTPDGGRVDVSAKLDTDQVQIAVKDTGVGIAPEDHAAVFEEFKQVGRDYTRKAEGTGLGLALTRRLVELHGGEIALESALGRGSTFTVRLPLR